MRRNPGYLPPEAVGKRIRALLVNGTSFEGPADGRSGCDWTIIGSPFDIAEYEVL